MREGVTLALLLITTLVTGIVPLTSAAIAQDDIPIIPDMDTIMLDPQQEAEIIEKADALLKSQFQENLGQMGNDEVLLYGRIPGGMIGFGISKVLIWLEGTSTSIVFTFVDAANVIPKMSAESTHESNYFLGDRGSFTNVKSFHEVSYIGLWPGIDLLYRATPNGVKYEYHVSPGGNPDDIIIDVEGHDKIEIDSTVLRLEVSGFPFFDEGLIAFQDDAVLNTLFVQVAPNRFGFLIPEYNPNIELVIDPLLFSTYVGGSNDETAYEVFVDSVGDIYITGYTLSSNFPTLNPYDAGANGNWDCFVFKLNSTGSGMIFSTYIGGSSNERAQGLFVDTDFSVFVSGYTTSSNFPMMNAYDSTINGGWDCFVTRISSSGSQLLYSTFIGGSANEYCDTIFIDDFGFIYGSGTTASSNFPIVSGYDTHSGSDDVMVFKLTPNGSSIVFSTCIGGSSNDQNYGFALTSNGSIILGGRTWSTNFPTLNAYDSTYNGAIDCFVAKLNATGNGLNFSTYIGGSGEEYFGKVFVDREDNIFVGGCTKSSDFPLKNAYDSTWNGGFDAFALKLNSTGNDIIFSTFIGGSGEETVYGVSVDFWGNMFISGVTTSTDLPDVNAYSSSLSGMEDGFVFKVNGTGNGLLYSTYFGGSNDDGQRGLTVDHLGRAVIVGWTLSSNFPTLNSYDGSINGGSDSFVICFSPLDDTDWDGLSDDQENTYGTNAMNNDTDSDGMLDGWEVFYGLNASEDDAADDLDLDGLTNLAEMLNGTEPDDPDSDDDNLDDALEILIHGTDPNDKDTDNDGYSDYIEVNIYGSDPLNPDSPFASKEPIFSTYIGGTSADVGYEIKIDSEGFIFVAGYSYSSDFPVVNAYDSTFNGNMDAFLLKFNETCTGLLYSTFFGGSSNDVAYGIEFDVDLNVYLTGYTASSNFPLVNAYQSSLGGNLDSYLIVLNKTGASLIYSSYLGGAADDIGGPLALDDQGYVYISGYTYSSNFPIINAYDGTIGGSPDAYLTKIKPDGAAPNFSTYLGGSAWDQCVSIELDSDGTIVLAGRTDSSDFPIVNALYDTLSGESDLFVARFNPLGTDLQSSTFIGGSNEEYMVGMKLDTDGNIIFSGTSESDDYPMLNAYDSTRNGGFDAFVTKLNNSCSALLYSTFVGGSNTDYSRGFGIDAWGNAYVTAETLSSNFPILNAYDNSPNGGYDTVVFKLNSTGNGLVYSTYFGGTSDDKPRGMTVDSYGKAYVSGYTYSMNLPMFNAYDSTFDGGSHDTYIFGLRSLGDIDGDGLDDDLEILLGLDPFSSDTDLDGMPDGWEYWNGLNCTLDDSAGDPDLDGLSNIEEYAHGADPNDSDTDDDLLSDDAEVNTWNTDPNDDDSDGDNLSDYEEVILHNTDPLKRDSEDDGMQDDYEVFCSLDPLVNDSGDDYDGDGLINIEEFLLGTWANVVDSDSDGLPDGYEVNTRGTDPLDASSPGNYVEYDWCEITGGNNGDFGYSIKVDTHGYIYVGGTTYSSTFPVLNAFQSSLMGGEDFFVYKLDPTGTTIIFSTYIGGSDSENLYDIDIDSSGNIYGTGASSSSDFPTMNAFSDTYGGSSDCIVFKLANTGDELDYSTYIGHSEWETGEAIAVDESGCAIVTGITVSPNFPTNEAYDKVWNGGADCFILGVDSSGDSLVFSTFFGGSENDFGNDITLDEQGDIYIIGYTDSTDFPTKNAIQNSHAGSYDSFIAKFRMPENQLIFSTYFGGSIRDVGKGITVDSIGNVIFVGETNSNDFPTSNSFDNQSHGEEDCFVTKLDSSGSSIIFSTYFAGSYDDIASSVVVDVADNVYVAGYTESYDFPTLNAYRDNRFRYYDCFLFKLNSTGQGLFYSTYFSGSEYEYCRDMTIDSSGHIYLTGQTNTYAFPVTGSTYGYTGAGSESFVLKVRSVGDEDGDGLPNDMEFEMGTDALSNDTDSDGMPDYWEVHNGLNATLDDADADLDQDGLSNILEYDMQTLPNNNDTDSDLMPDGWEVTHDLNPKGDDSNNDIDSDNLVNYLEYSFGTEPRNNDTDSDMIPDGWEYWNGLNGTVNDAGEE
ncbi:MAG: SBBP repeat-containing protein [Candidatus Thorarchaeota archaeon]|jgi:uncharacterized delta-60 repeat protein